MGMDKQERYEFDINKYYKLVSIVDHDGVDKSDTNNLYAERINCIATHLVLDYYDRVMMVFVEDSEGKRIRKALHTSIAERIDEIPNGLRIYTLNSIYTFEDVTINISEPQDVSEYTRFINF